MNHNSLSTDPPPPRPRFNLWPGMIFFLLAINFIIVAATIYFAQISKTPVLETHDAPPAHVRR